MEEKVPLEDVTLSGPGSAPQAAPGAMQYTVLQSAPGQPLPLSYQPGSLPPGAVGYQPGVAPVVMMVPGNMMDPSTTFTDYTVFVLIATILCGILAFPSLVFGVPATLLALGAQKHKKAGEWGQARTKSLASFYLTIGTLFVGAFLFTVWMAFTIPYGIIETQYKN